MATNRAELILCAVRGYLRYSLSFRDVEELLSERGLEGGPHDNLALGPALRSGTGGAAAPSFKPTNKSWRVDETYVRVKGRVGATSTEPSIPPAPRSILCSRGCAMPLRLNACSARRWRLRRIDSPGLSIRTSRPSTSYAISGVKQEGILRRCCHHRPVQYILGACRE